MSTVFFTGQNQKTGATELYSVTSSSLGNLHDFLSPSSDIVTSIWQKRYVFLNDKYYDGMSSDVEKTDANTIVNRTVSMSEAKLRNKKTDDVKYRFTANGLKQFKKDEGISLLLKIDEYADEFVLLPAAEEIQLKPTARKILELIDKSRQIFTEDVLVHSTEGGNIVAWRVGSFNGHTVLVLENTPDAQKFVLANEDAIVGLVHHVPAEFDANAVAVNAKFFVGNEPKDCMQRGNENIREPLVAGSTAQVVRQWKNYFELSLSDNSHVVVELTMGSDDGCHVEYGVYGERRFQYIELTKVTPIEGEPSSIGSRWRVSSMDFTGITPEINVFTPDVKETITDLDAFKFVQDLSMISLANTTLKVVRDVNLRPSFSLEIGHSYGKLVTGTSGIVVDSVVYDNKGRAWFHVKNEEGLPLTNKPAVLANSVIKQGWVNGKCTEEGAEQTFRFEELPVEQRDGYNLREKACDYVIVTQNLGLIEEDLNNQKAWTMDSVDAVGADDKEATIPAGREVRLVHKTIDHLKFKVAETLYTVPVSALGTSIRIDATPEHASAFVPKDNEIKIGDTYQCIMKNDTLQSFCAFVVDDLIEETIDAVASSVMSGNEIFTVLGEHTHGSVRYLQLMSGDDEEGTTFWADASSVVIPTSYDIAEGDKAKSFAPEGVIFLESPLSNREAAVERREAGSSIDDLMDSAKGVNVKSAWGISVTAEDKTVFTNSKLCTLERYPTWRSASVHVLGTTKSVRPVKFYGDGETIKAFVYGETVKSIDGVDGDFHVSDNDVKDISNSTISFARSIKEIDGVQQYDIIWGDMEPVNKDELSSFALIRDFASDEYFLMGVSDDTDVFERDDDSDFVTSSRFITHGSFEAITNFNHEKVAITGAEKQVWDGCRVLKGISKSGNNTTNLYVYTTPEGELRMLTRRWDDVMSDESRGTLIVMNRFSSISSLDGFVTVSDPDGVVRKVSADTTVPKYYVKAHNANGNYIDIDCFPAQGEYRANVTAGTIPSIVKKVSTKDADGNVVVYLISDEGLAYPESVLEEVQDSSFNDQYADNPVKLWITRDPGFARDKDFNIIDNPVSTICDAIVLPCYTSPNDDEPEEESFTFDAHGAVVDLLGENGIGYTVDGSWIHIRHNEKTGYVHNILLNAVSLYASKVEKADTKAVFVGSTLYSDRQSLAEFGTSAKNQCETDSMDGNSIILRQGDIVSFSWKYIGEKPVMLFEKDESSETQNGSSTHTVIHSVYMDRIAESFAEIDPAKDMFYINQGIPASLSYGDVETLSSVPSYIVPMPNGSENLFIAPGIPTDAYMSYRISLKNDMVEDDNGNVDVSGYSFQFRQPMVATQKVTAGNNIYYAFPANILHGVNSENVGTVTVWALSSQLSRVAEFTEEDIDLHMFPKKIGQSDVVYLLDAPNNSANPTELAGVPELRAEKACKENGVVKYYKLAGDQAGKYIDVDHVVIIQDADNIRLFHNGNANSDFLSNPMYAHAQGISDNIAHALFMTPLRKVSYKTGQQTIVAYKVGIALLDSNATREAWILDGNVTEVPTWVEAPAISNERISIDANTDALLWPGYANAPVMHTFAETTEMDLHSIVKNNDDSTKYYCVSMKRSELNKADPHISVDDPRTIDIDERTVSIVLYIPVDHAHQVQPSAVESDVDDFNMFVGDVDGVDVSGKTGKGWSENSIGSAFMSKWTKADGSGAQLTQSEGDALISYLAAHQWVAPVDVAYSKDNKVIAYRVAYRDEVDNGINMLACLTLDDTITEEWVSEQKVTQLINQDAVVVESDNNTEGEILNVLWKFTTEKDSSERRGCGIAVPADLPDSSVCEIVQIITL